MGLDIYLNPFIIFLLKGVSTVLMYIIEFINKIKWGRRDLNPHAYH